MRRMLAALALLLPFAIAAPAAATIYPTPPTLIGNNIPALASSTVYLPADQPSHYGFHGWLFPVYQDYGGDTAFVSWTLQQQLAFFDDSVWRHELWVAPPGGTLTQVPLTKVIWYDTDPPGIATINKRWYANFPAGTFAPGTYTFQVVWYGDPTVTQATSEPEFVRTFTVVFT